MSPSEGSQFAATRAQAGNPLLVWSPDWKEALRVTLCVRWRRLLSFALGTEQTSVFKP